MVVIVLWQKVLSTIREKNQREYHIVVVEKTKNYYIKHNKTICNFNVYYLPLIFNILQVQQNKYNIFSTIFLYNNQSTKYFDIWVKAHYGGQKL
jgi:hypothetical protein